MKYSEYYLNNDQNFRFFIRKWMPETPPKGLLLLLHGLSDHGGRFAFVAESFVKAGFIFVAPDLRGNGKTDGIRGHYDSTDQMMNDINFLLQDCRNAHPGIPLMLYSQSMGGNLAINYALRFPGEILCAVASSPWLGLTKPPAPALQWIVSKLLKVFPQLTISNGLNSKDLSHDNTNSEEYKNDKLIHGKVSISTFMNIKESSEWAINNAASLRIPLLLMHSDTDPITSFAASERFHQNANSFLTFRAYTGLFHELHNEPGNKEAIVQDAIKWVKLQVSGGDQ